MMTPSPLPPSVLPTSLVVSRLPFTKRLPLVHLPVAEARVGVWRVVEVVKEVMHQAVRHRLYCVPPPPNEEAPEWEKICARRRDVEKREKEHPSHHGKRAPFVLLVKKRRRGVTTVARAMAKPWIAFPPRVFLKYILWGLRCFPFHFLLLFIFQTHKEVSPARHPLAPLPLPPEKNPPKKQRWRKMQTAVESEVVWVEQVPLRSLLARLFPLFLPYRCERLPPDGVKEEEVVSLVRAVARGVLVALNEVWYSSLIVPTRAMRGRLNPPVRQLVVLVAGQRRSVAYEPH